MLKALTPFVGKWSGEGLATYPTMDDVAYRERLVIRPNDANTYLQIEQKTWLTWGGEQSHWEFGFIRPTEEDPALDWVNTQSGGRVEVLKGQLHLEDDLTRLVFTAVLFGNDDRLVKATRQLTLDGDSLRYEQHMATQATPTLTQHLAATLSRQPG